MRAAGGCGVELVPSELITKACVCAGCGLPPRLSGSAVGSGVAAVAASLGGPVVGGGGLARRAWRGSLLRRRASPV